MILIRPYTTKDSIQLSQAIDQVCADTPWMSTQSFIPTSPWIHAMEYDKCHFHRLLVAETNGDVAGWCRSFPTVCKKPLSNAELGIGLLKEYRNQGVGSELILRSLDWAKTVGLSTINLTVARRNSVAIHVFENCGFELVNLQGDKMVMSVDLS